MPPLYHVMNKTIGGWGDKLYVHNAVPGIIAMTSTSSCVHPDLVIYGVKKDIIRVFKNARNPCWWINEFIDDIWGWEDPHFGTSYRFKARSDIIPIEKDIQIRFKQIAELYNRR